MRIASKTFLLLILIFHLPACNLFPLNHLYSAQTIDIQNSEIIFSDDFSNSSSGWDRQRNTDGVTDYQNGRYLIEVDRANFDYFSNPSISLADGRVEVEATNSSEVEDNEFGVICRFQNKNNFYAGLISSDGYYGIFKVKGGEYQLLGMEVMPKSTAIKSGSEKNLIRLDCIGSNLRLFVNGVQLDERQDADFTKGDVGLLAGSYQVPGVKVLFDNFIVRKP